MLAIAGPSLTSAAYTLKNDLSYKNFFQNFDFFTGPDPTKGFVQYQNLSSAIENNYVGYLPDSESVFLGVDYTSKDTNGRASIRVESKSVFNQGLLIADIKHMPANVCGSWPAFWMLGGPKWPDQGEVDILEGVNDETRNAITLHTATGCVVDNATMGGQGGSEQQEFLGNMFTDNCDVAAEDQAKNVGCSIKAPARVGNQPLPSYGSEFNAAGGGIYALEWTGEYIQAWFFPRNSSTSPNAKQLLESPDPTVWPTPIAKFQGSGCDFSARFKDQKIIFNTAFCGEWAGRIWEDSCAAKTGVEKCEDYVRDNPEAFSEVYWEIKGLRWFEQDGNEKRSLPLLPKTPGRQYRW